MNDQGRGAEGGGGEPTGFDLLPVILDRLQQLEAQGQAISALDSPDSQEVARALRLLSQRGRGLQAAWERQQQRLQQGLELQRFGRDVDGFAATCASHEAFLQQDKLGVGAGDTGLQACFPITGGSLEVGGGGPRGPGASGGQDGADPIVPSMTPGLCTPRTM